MQIVQSGGKRREYTITAVAVYDPETGRVHHIHHTVALADRKAPGAAVRAKEALDHATEAGHDATKLATLALKEAPAPGAYRVDLKKKTLVRLPTPARPGFGRR